jgi:hypothetical protein
MAWAKGEGDMRTLLEMGEYKVTTEGGWVSLWCGTELEQTMPASYFPKKTAERVELVTAMIHGQERATEALIDELELRGYEVRPVASPNRGSDFS